MEGNRVDGVPVPGEGMLGGTRRRKPIRVVSSAETGRESGHVRVVVQRFLQPSFQVQYLFNDDDDGSGCGRGSDLMRGTHLLLHPDHARPLLYEEAIALLPEIWLEVRLQ